MVTKFSGSGQDTVFMGVMRAAAEDQSTVKVYITTKGTVLCMDRRFSDWFGYSNEELLGHPFSTVAFNKGQVAGLIEAAEKSSEEALDDGEVRQG